MDEKEEEEPSRSLGPKEMKEKFIKKEELPVLTDFQIRPQIEQRFRSMFVKEVIHSVLYDELTGKVYGEVDIPSLLKKLVNTIRARLEGRIYDRYKFVVEVTLGEQRGAGVKTVARCLWDPECDSYASNYFMNDTIFCTATVFGIYFY